MSRAKSRQIAPNVSRASTRIGSASSAHHSFIGSRGRGGRVDIVISDAAVGHSLVEIVVTNPTRRRDLVERAARHDLVGATDAERRKETHCRDRAAGTKFVPFAL